MTPLFSTRRTRTPVVRPKLPATNQRLPQATTVLSALSMATSGAVPAPMVCVLIKAPVLEYRFRTTLPPTV
jgi:hypothetical protein